MAKDRENNPFVEDYDRDDQSAEDGGPEDEKNERKVRTMLRNHSSYNTVDIFQGEDKEQAESKSIRDQNNENERSEVSNEDGTNSDFMPSSKERTVLKSMLLGKISSIYYVLAGPQCEI